MLLLLLLSRFSHVRLCDPIDGSPPGSSIPGILQARTLEWAASSFSNAWKWKVKVKSLSHVRLFKTPWTVAYKALPSMGFSRQEYWSGVPLPSLMNICCCCCCSVTSVVSNPVRPHRWQPTRLPHLWDSQDKNTAVGCHFLLQCVKVESESEVTQSCPTRSNPMDCSLPVSSIHGIFQARVLEWGAIAFSRIYVRLNKIKVLFL